MISDDTTTIDSIFMIIPMLRQRSRLAILLATAALLVAAVLQSFQVDHAWLDHSSSSGNSSRGITMSGNHARTTNHQHKEKDTIQSPLPQPQQMQPLTSATGGIIFFFHGPKTGGTTIRDNFQNAQNFPMIDFTGVYVSRQWKRVQKQVQEKLQVSPNSSTNKTILFVEIHNRQRPSWMMDIAPRVQQWKHEAKEQGIPFYAFTLLRDPVDLAISYFNYFHVLGGIFGDERMLPQVNGTVESFRQVVLHEPSSSLSPPSSTSNQQHFNPQCLYFLKGELVETTRPTARDCQRVQQSLHETMDWIGDTKTMSHDTLPLLLYLITGQRQQDRSTHKQQQQQLKTSNQSKKRQHVRGKDTVVLLSRNAINEETMDLLQHKTQWDQHYLYQPLLTPPAYFDIAYHESTS